MESQATYEDVNLVLRLYELRREQKLRAAREWFGANFKARNLDELATLCPIGSEESAYFRMVISYWEMVSSFITSGVLIFVWEKFKDLVPATRERYKNPGLYRNFETVANAFIQWMTRQAPEAYAAFAARIRAT